MIGALPLAGSSRGCTSTVELTQSGPMQASIPDAVAPSGQHQAGGECCDYREPLSSISAPYRL